MGTVGQALKMTTSTSIVESDGGKSEYNIVQTKNIFCNMQDALESVVRKMDPIVTRGG